MVAAHSVAVAVGAVPKDRSAFHRVLAGRPPGSPLAPEGGSRAAAISTAQPDHHLARPAPLSRRCHASGSQPSPELVPGLQRTLIQSVANIQPPRPRRVLPGDE